MPKDPSIGLVTGLDKLTPERRSTDRRRRDVPVSDERRRDARRQARQLKPSQHFTGVAIVIDTNPMYRAGVQAQLQEAGMRVASCKSTVSEAVQDIGDRLDLVVVGTTPEDETSIMACIQSIDERTAFTQKARVLLVLNNFQPKYVRDKLQSGVHGIVERGIGLQDFQASVARLLAGDRVLSGRPLAALASAGLEPSDQSDDQVHTDKLLTNKEFEVLTYLALHLTNKEIADTLCISEGTIKTHCSNIYGKLQVPGRREAILAAVERGLLH